MDTIIEEFEISDQCKLTEQENWATKWLLNIKSAFTNPFRRIYEKVCPAKNDIKELLKFDQKQIDETKKRLKEEPGISDDYQLFRHIFMIYITKIENDDDRILARCHWYHSFDQTIGQIRLHIVETFALLDKNHVKYVDKDELTICGVPLKEFNKDQPQGKYNHKLGMYMLMQFGAIEVYTDYLL
uniref:Uncharacterized protein n=1 Tax=Abalone asfa-like virus TaxID=2839893 RepID=A0A5K7XX99_9VIRU|nr:hypothetical protein [Abalone asfa-like virus]BCY04641.1 hypothetical protein [Abalone asfa-like virus]